MGDPLRFRDDQAPDEPGVTLDAFLDLQAAWGNDLRWYSVVANGNPEAVEWIMSHPVALIGFSDAGAHLRNMGFYNFPLRMLKRVRDAQLEGRGFMTVEAAVAKLTAEIADFHRLDVGRAQERRPPRQPDVTLAELAAAARQLRIERGDLRRQTRVSARSAVRDRRARKPRAQVRPSGGGTRSGRSNHSTLVREPSAGTSAWTGESAATQPCTVNVSAMGRTVGRSMHQWLCGRGADMRLSEPKRLGAPVDERTFFICAEADLCLSADA